MAATGVKIFLASLTAWGRSAVAAAIEMGEIATRIAAVTATPIERVRDDLARAVAAHATGLDIAAEQLASAIWGCDSSEDLAGSVVSSADFTSVLQGEVDDPDPEPIRAESFDDWLERTAALLEERAERRRGPNE